LRRGDQSSLIALMDFTSAPLLETERLRLRPFGAEDFEPFATLYQSDRSIYMDGPIDPADAWNAFAASAGCWPLLGYGPWAIERKEDTQCVGFVSLNPPIGDKEKELGWALWEPYTGKGYAFEAANRACAFAVQELGWASFVSYIDAANTASIKLAERLGGACDSKATQKQTDDTLVYRHVI